MAVLPAASPRVGAASDVAFVIAAVIVYLVPLYVGYRIAIRKGFTISQWLWQPLFFNWLGVLYLVLKAPSDRKTPSTPSEYHVPPGIDTRRQDVRDSPLYGRRRR